MLCSFLEIGMKTSLASELAGGIACPTNATPGLVKVSEFTERHVVLPNAI